jgi:hypothetical protein
VTLARRRLVLALLIPTSIVLLLAAGLQLATRQLRAQIEAALGPRASVGAISAGWNGIELRELRIRSASGWPVEDELRANRVHLRPDLRSLFGGPWRIASVQVEGGFVSALRTRDGRLRLLPALLEERAAAGESPTQSEDKTTPIEIAELRLSDSSLAFFDHSVRHPAWPLRVEQLAATVGPLLLPALDQAIELQLDGVFKRYPRAGQRDGQRDGRLAIQGQYTPASHDAQVRARFSGVDLVALQPYLLKGPDNGIRRGTLDLELQASVVKQRLHAPGKMVLTDLQLTSQGPLATFAGVPRQAVLAAMTRDGRLEVRFTLEGRLDDPAFSLNENLSTKLAAGLANGLGVSISGVVQGVGSVVKGLFGR